MPRKPATAQAAASGTGRNVLPIGQAIGALLTAALPVLSLLGVDLPEALPAQVAALVGAAVLVWGTIYSRLRVTPLVDPRDATGRPLVVEGKVTRPGDGTTLRRDPGQLGG